VESLTEEQGRAQLWLLMVVLVNGFNHYNYSNHFNLYNHYNIYNQSNAIQLLPQTTKAPDTGGFCICF
jgi:hypothetical protein